MGLAAADAMAAMAATAIACMLAVTGGCYFVSAIATVLPSFATGCCFTSAVAATVAKTTSFALNCSFTSGFGSIATACMQMDAGITCTAAAACTAAPATPLKQAAAGGGLLLVSAAPSGKFLIVAPASAAHTLDTPTTRAGAYDDRRLVANVRRNATLSTRAVTGRERGLPELVKLRLFDLDGGGQGESVAVVVLPM